MSRFYRQSLVVLGVIFCALIAQSIYFGLYGDWTNYFRQRAREANFLMSADAIESRFPLGLAVRKLGLVIPVGRIPVPVAIDSGTVGLRLRSLFALQGQVEYQAKMYGGQVHGSIRRALFGEQLRFEIHALDLLIERYPQPFANLFDGRITVHSEGLAEPDKKGGYQVVSNELSGVIEDGQYRGGLKIQGLIPVPPISNIRANFSAETSGGTLKISRFECDSSMGKVSGHGRFQVNAAMQPKEGTATFSISLTDDGAKAFAGYLQLGAQGKGSPQTKIWDGTLQLNAGKAMPAIQILPRD